MQTTRSLCTVALSGLLLVVYVGSAAAPPGETGGSTIQGAPGAGVDHHCTGDELNRRSCDDPDRCENACAYHCATDRSCRRCCLHFASDPDDYDECNGYCDDVFKAMAFEGISPTD